MPKHPFRVGRARTGLGLFATEIIKKGDFIAEYKGRRLNNELAAKLEARGSKYMYEINSRWTIDGSSRSNVARYANHSCRPNAESDVTRQRKVIIRAIKTIRPGDEITYDYGKDYLENVITRAGCKCEKCMEKRREQRREARVKKQRSEARRAKSGKSATAKKTASKTKKRSTKTTKTKTTKTKTSQTKRKTKAKKR